MSTIKANTVTAKDSNTNLVLQGDGSGKVAIGDGSLIFPDSDGSSGQFIKTNGSGTLSFDTVSSGRTIAVNHKALGAYSSSTINGDVLPTNWSISHTLANSANALLFAGYARGYHAGTSGNVYTMIKLFQDGSLLTESSAPDSGSIDYRVEAYFSSQNFMDGMYTEVMINPGDTSAHTYQLYIYGNAGGQGNPTLSWTNAYMRLTEIDGSICTVA